jgi:glyoxylase-like metal-dependent hydrolase (beta-lactamase superfamily II)
MDGHTKTIKLGGVNAYLVKVTGTSGSSIEAFVLIDTGFSRAWPRLRAALQAEGCLAENLRLVILTHGDMDHVGNCAKLRREYGAPSAIQGGDLRAVEMGVPPKRLNRGLLGKAMGLLGSAMSGLQRRPLFETFTPDLILEDGQSLEDYGFAARVIHVPGHTKGSIAILAEDGSLYAGDTLFDMKHPPLFIENLDEFRSSVAKLRSIQTEVKTVYPGHGKPFVGERMGRMRV